MWLFTLLARIEIDRPKLVVPMLEGLELFGLGVGVAASFEGLGYVEK